MALRQCRVPLHFRAVVQQTSHNHFIVVKQQTSEILGQSTVHVDEGRRCVKGAYGSSGWW